MPIDQRTNFLIAYGDHVTAPDEAPLSTLARFVSGHLAPDISGVHTLPIHPSTGDGGFSVVDHAEVDSQLGEWAHLRRLASETAWMADAVVNHVSAASPWLAGYLAGEPAFDGFFRELDAGTDVSAVTRPRTSPLGHDFARPDGTSVRLWTTFSADQVDLDFSNPAVLVAITEVVLRFAAAGAAAIRLDAIAFAWKDPARSSMSLPETHAVVAHLRSCLDEAAPGCLLITETNVPQAENLSYFGSTAAPEAHAVYQFPLPPLVLHTLLSGDSTVLVRWLRDLAQPPPGCTFANMLATHDGIGLRGAEGLLDGQQLGALAEAAQACGGVVNWRSTSAGPAPYELCTTWYSVMAHGFDDDAAMARHVASHAIAIALQGIPLLYLGALVASENDLARLTVTGHGRDVNRTRFDAHTLAAALADPDSPAARSWTALGELLEVRASSPAFHPSAAQAVHDAGAAVVVIERRAASGETAVVAVNVTARPVEVVTAGETFRLVPWGVEVRLR